MSYLTRIGSTAGEVRQDPGWLTRQDELDMAPGSPSGVRVTRRTALSLTTLWRCVDLLSSAVAQAPHEVIVRVGGRSYPEYRNIPPWLTQPDPQNPAYTFGDHLAQAVVSLLLDGNYFVVADPYVGAATALTVLDPQRVDIRMDGGSPVYELRSPTGKVIATFYADEVLHGTWMRLPGEVRGISPLETLRRAIGAGIAADDFAARYFGQGASLSFGVEVPGDLTAQQKDDMAAQLRRKHQGLSNSHAVGILTRGAKFVPGLAPTPEQSQMLATRQFGVEDVARVFGVPPHMAGSQQPGASSHASASVFKEEFAELALLPLVNRIESQYSRLVQVPPALEGTGATATLNIDLDHYYRTDMPTRYAAYGEAITKGWMYPSEARAREDMPPAGPEADRLYMQAQMTPIDTLGQPPAQKQGGSA